MASPGYRARSACTRSQRLSVRKKKKIPCQVLTEYMFKMFWYVRINKLNKSNFCCFFLLLLIWLRNFLITCVAPGGGLHCVSVGQLHSKD